MQVGDVHLQRPGARRPVAVVLLQRAGNHLTLKRLCRVTQIFMRSLWYSLRNRRNFIMLRKMPGMYNHFITRTRRSRQHHRAVNRVLQLAHVARPAVAQQMRPRPRA